MKKVELILKKASLFEKLAQEASSVGEETTASNFLKEYNALKNNLALYLKTLIEREKYNAIKFKLQRATTFIMNDNIDNDNIDEAFKVLENTPYYNNLIGYKYKFDNLRTEFKSTVPDSTKQVTLEEVKISPEKDVRKSLSGLAKYYNIIANGNKFIDKLFLIPWDRNIEGGAKLLVSQKDNFNSEYKKVYDSEFEITQKFGDHLDDPQFNEVKTLYNRILKLKDLFSKMFNRMKESERIVSAKK